MDPSYSSSLGNLNPGGTNPNGGFPQSSQPLSSGQGDIVLTPSQPKKFKKWLIVSAIVVIVLILGILIIFFYSKKQSLPEIYTAYYNYILSGDTNNDSYFYEEVPYISYISYSDSPSSDETKESYGEIKKLLINGEKRADDAEVASAIATLSNMINAYQTISAVVYGDEITRLYLNNNIKEFDDFLSYTGCEKAELENIYYSDYLEIAKEYYSTWVDLLNNYVKIGCTEEEEVDYSCVNDWRDNNDDLENMISSSETYLNSLRSYQNLLLNDILSLSSDIHNYLIGNETNG